MSGDNRNFLSIVKGKYKMTEEKLNKQSEPVEQKASADKMPEKKRRRLIKGAAAAIPVIMTLHSGAALARTSNLVRAITDIDAAAKDGAGNLICVRPDVDGGLSSVGSDLVDLGTDPIASVTDTKKDGVPDLQSQADFCHTEAGGQGVGILVSSRAYDSITASPNLNI